MKTTLATNVSGILVLAITWIFGRDFLAAIPGFDRMADVQPWSVAAAAIWLYCVVFMTSAAWANGQKAISDETLRRLDEISRKANLIAKCGNR